MNTLSRRDLLKGAGAATVAVASSPQVEASAVPREASQDRPLICFFSKHLPELGPRELGRAVKDAGFDGVDLTVRAQGHVLPDKAATELPRAIDAITASGAAVPMITTELTSARHPSARGLLQAAAKSGVRYFKTGYWRWTADGDVKVQAASAGEDLAGLAELARECGIELGFHNHAAYIGAALWDIAPAMDRLDPRWTGYYFDPRHAVAEGGGGAWKAAARLVAPRLKMVALKDFYWDKGPRGWRIADCPLGSGMVEWAWFGGALKEARFAGPVSLHFEYEIPGDTPVARAANTLAAAVRDLAFARGMLGL